MSSGRSKDLVAAGALLAAVALGGFLLLRARGALGTSFTDGQRSFASTSGADVRHAVWDRPEASPAVGEAADPTLAPDGLVLVFASGARGLNAELFVAELVEGRPGTPRALRELNTPGDELAPAFGPDGLYFASERAGGAGGLDLWRAPYERGTFGPAERLGPGLNSAADETDPAPVPGARALLFASNRARADFDLYAAAPDEASFFAPHALTALNSAAEEREPAFPGDARSLYFASDRADGAGGFDLFRALCFGADWQPPAPLVELNTAADERGPWPAADGFALWFARSGTGSASELWRARSLELFRVPPPAVTLAQWLTLGALLLLALLALLAKRWSALDILWKCLLVSLLVHLLLMLYLRTVLPESRSYETGTDEGPTFRVRLAPAESAPDAPDARGLSGPLAPARELFTPASTPAAAPEALALALPEAPAEAAPEREASLARAADAAPAPELAAPEEASARAAAPAPELALSARGAAPLAAPAAGAPTRATGGAPERAQAEPGAAELTAKAAASAALDRGVARAPELERGTAQAPAPTLAAPAETFARAAGSAPALALEASSSETSSAATRTGSPPEREALGPVAGAAERATPAAGAPRAAPVLAAEAPALPAPERVLLDPGAAREGPAPELRAPMRENRAAAGSATPSLAFDATAGLGATRAPVRSAPSVPARALAATPAQPAPARPAPRALALESAAAAADDGPLETTPAPRMAETPYQNRFGAQKLRALEEFGGTRETEHAVAAGLAYLARIQNESGAWGQRGDGHEKYLDVRVGKSALALLAFLGAGHVPEGTSEHAAVVRRTVDYLLATQDAASGHFGRSCSYGHGIATYALAECYALTRDARLRPAIERALAEILRHQSTERDPRFFGGWGYYFADGHVWNGDEWPRTSVTAWQVMALESARLGGLEVPDQAFEGAREFLVNTWDPRARAFRYAHDPARLASGYPILPASTPAALFALSLLGIDARSEELASARRFVLARLPDGYRYTGADDFVERARGNLYFWYYASLALFRVGGNEWERWNAALKETLLPAQDADGSWRPLDTYAEYAGDEDEERTYTTAMCVLSLEVYYRYFTPLLQVR